MKRPFFLSIVMPAYNEQAHIEAVIREHIDIVAGLGDSLDDWEIVCLDDGSQDGTAEIVRRLSEHTKKVRLVVHTENKGIHQSLVDLYLSARGTHIYFTGSDGEWPAENLIKMFPALEAGADLVIGVRQNRSEVYSLRRRVISYGFNLLTKLLFGLATRDAGSIKLGVRDVFTCDVISQSPFSEAERIILAHRRGYRVDFVPIQFLHRLHGKGKGATWRNVFGSLWDCLRLFAHINVQGTSKPTITQPARHRS
jgi:glycosyltransferase involved in cell wall biosynthesis